MGTINNHWLIATQVPLCIVSACHPLASQHFNVDTSPIVLSSRKSQTVIYTCDFAATTCFRPCQHRGAEAPLCLSILPQPAVELVYMMYVYYHLCKEVVAVYCQPWYIFEHSDSWYWVNTLVSCSNVRGMCEVTKHHSGNYKLLSKVQSSRWIFGFF